jgi:hypothetical protein
LNEDGYRPPLQEINNPLPTKEAGIKSGYSRRQIINAATPQTIGFFRFHS